MSGNFTVKSFEQTRTDWLRTFRELMIRAGVADPDISPGTAAYIRASATAQETSALGYNISILANDVLPDTAQGDELLRHARLLGLSLRPAGGSAGPMVFSTSSSPSAVATGAGLIDPSGLKYKVAVGGSYSDGDLIPIEAIDTGTATNLGASVVLRWTTAPAFASQTALVGPGGLTGGADAEDLEGLRARVLAAWQSPEDGDNPTQMASWLEEASAEVQKGFIYSCYNGPSTAALVAVRAPTATDKHRDVAALTMTGVVAPFITSKISEFVDAPVSTVANQETVASFGLSLPAYSTGLGWLNELPWPVYATNGYANVVGVTSTTVFQVNADTPPAPGVSQVCWVSPLDWKIYRGLVKSYTGTGPWTVTVDRPFVGIAIGHLVMPEAVGTDSYVAAVLTQFANLGPGEKTSAAGLLPRALRQPFPSQSWPSSIGPSILKFLSNVGDEVLDVQFLYRSHTVPDVPSLASSPPNILTPAGVGLYPLP